MSACNRCQRSAAELPTRTCTDPNCDILLLRGVAPAEAVASPPPGEPRFLSQLAGGLTPLPAGNLLESDIIDRVAQRCSASGIPVTATGIATIADYLREESARHREAELARGSVHGGGVHGDPFTAARTSPASGNGGPSSPTSDRSAICG